ncbi:MAG: MerR family transcriptional regulator [Alphaproteobacteria bacterium]
MAVSSGDEAAGIRRAKSAAAFRTISEVAEELDVPQHVLRFWETKFGQIRPLKRGGGRRYYRPEDVLLLQRIRRLLYDEGYTIKGVQRLLREGGRGGVVAQPLPQVVAPPLMPGPAADADEPDDLDDLEGADDEAAVRLRAALTEALDEMVVLRALLKAVEKRGQPQE